MAWWSAQQLRAVYNAPTAEEGRRRAQAVLDALPGCPIPEVARLGRTLRAWRAEFLAYFDTGGASNGPTEAIILWSPGNGVFDVADGGVEPSSATRSLPAVLDVPHVVAGLE